MPKQKNVIVGSVGIILWEAADLQISKITFEIALTHGSLYEILEIGILYGKIYIFFFGETIRTILLLHCASQMNWHI